MNTYTRVVDTIVVNLNADGTRISSIFHNGENIKDQGYASVFNVSPRDLVDEMVKHGWTCEKHAEKSAVFSKGKANVVYPPLVSIKDQVVVNLSRNGQVSSISMSAQAAIALGSDSTKVKGRFSLEQVKARLAKAGYAVEKATKISAVYIPVSA